MNDNTLLDLANRMDNDLFVGVVGSIRAGKSTFISSFFKLMILPNIKDEFVKQKIIDELPQTSPGKQIMTVEPKFIPSMNLSMELQDVLINLRFVDCVGQVIPSGVGYGTDSEPRLVKTPWYEEAIPFKEAAQIGTEKVIYNHSNLGIYVTSDGSFGEFSRTEYEDVENELIPKIKALNKPFVIILNTKDPYDKKAVKLKNDIEKKFNVSVISVSAINMSKDDCINILKAALSEFPIKEMSINLPDWYEALSNECETKIKIDDLLMTEQKSLNKIKDVSSMVDRLKASMYFSNVSMNLLNLSSGKVEIDLTLDDDIYNKEIEETLGRLTKREFLEFINKSKKSSSLMSLVEDSIEEALETGYSITIPTVDQMEMLEPTLAKKNGLYGVKLTSKAKCLHMISTDIEASFTPIIGSIDQAKMMINSVDKDDNKIWQQEFFGKKFQDIVNETMKSKIMGINVQSKEKIKNALTKVMNSERSNLIAIIL